MPSAPALAQAATEAPPPPVTARQADETAASPAAPSSPTASLPAAPPDAAAAAMIKEAAKFAAFDQWKPQGQTSNVPGTFDSILQDKGGFRSWLDDHDLYFRGEEIGILTRDVNSGRFPTSPQMFNGQKTSWSNTVELTGSYRFAQSGNDFAQINAQFYVSRVSWAQNGPNYIGTDRLDYYQTFFNRKVEFSAGLGDNLLNYIGIFSGGNLVLANGLAATIPVEVGLSGGNAILPFANLQINGKNGFYSKTGLQRSSRPEGAIVEAMTNHGGFRLTAPGARPLVIQEFGVLRPASAEANQMWLRFGGIYNPTKYDRLDGRGTERNWAAYALADYQVFKPDPQQSYRGIFVGASVLMAPGSVNVFKQTYEARAYAVGMVPDRPTDALNVTLDYNRFSRSGRDTFSELGLETHRYQLAIGVLYALHMTRGLYLSPSVNYVRNPAFVGDFKPAVNLATALLVLL